MSRSGYDSQYDPAQNLYRANVERAIAGGRGQQFFKDLVAALERLPDKRLIADKLEDHEGVCALGALGRARGLDLSTFDPEDAATVARIFRVAECLAREVVYENDEGIDFAAESQQDRYKRMLDWAKAQVRYHPSGPPAKTNERGS